MREFTTNRTTFNIRKNEIIYNVKNNGKDSSGKNVFQFTTTCSHGLSNGDTVLLVKQFVEDTRKYRLENHKYTFPTEKECEVEVIDDLNFVIKFSNYAFVNVENYDSGNHGAQLVFKDNPIQYYVNDDTNIEIVSSGETLTGSIGLKYQINEETGEEECTNAEDFSAITAGFDKPLPHIVFNGFVYVKNTWHLKCGSDTEFDGENIRIYNRHFYLSNFLLLGNAESYKVDDDAVVAKNFLAEMTKDIIPDIVDNEKRQFIPCIKTFWGDKLAQEIVFNLHFRERDDMLTFNLKDKFIWNGFDWKEEEKTIVKKIDGYDDRLGDELNKLGFTEDDVKFQKTKLKKTFLRLLFYSSPSMLDKDLLYYSTIFLDTGELFLKYAFIKNSVDESGTSSVLVFDDKKTDDKLRLSAQFKVKNKYDSTKSSEGFYLYLFPDEVQEENAPRTIYMKVEFNHAGYGKTIPMMLPRHKDENGEYTISGAPILSTEADFPINFLKKDENGNIDNKFQELSDSVMIPLNILYDRNEKKYKYYFPWYTEYANETNKIIINLWEPRVLGNVYGNS